QGIDVIITDIEMPRMDGFELLTAIRANHHLNDLPVIVLTSRSGEKHRSRAYELGANGYIVKPFQEQELITSVSRFARARPSRRS
ncbi:MAG: response regulator, partial [Chloroflexota bacterium]